jgi:RPA family protein
MSSASDNSDSRTDTQTTQRARQPAKRAFAEEYHDASYLFQDGDSERAPKFALFPTGERANRLAIVGTLTECEDIGSNDEFWQARIVDPTGTHFAYAGQYQDEALRQLAEIEPPEYVAVIGKPRTHESNGETFVSVTMESITVVDRATRDRWVLETADQTQERIEAFSSDDPPADAELAHEHYEADAAIYLSCVTDALDDLTEDSEPA